MANLPTPRDDHQGRLVTVEFHGDTVEVIAHDGELWVSVRRVCEALGLNPDGQRVKLGEKSWARTEMISVRDARGRQQEAYCIHIDKLPMWLATIDENRVSAHVREKLTAYQCEAAEPNDNG